MKDPFEMKAVEYRVFSKIATNITPPKLTTGGSGTRIFYIAAALIATGCAVAYLIKRKKG